MARQCVPGYRLRHPGASVFVLVPSACRLGDVVPARCGDPRLLAAHRRRGGTDAVHQARLRAGRCAVGRVVGAMVPRDRQGPCAGADAGAGGRAAVRAARSRHRRTGRLFGDGGAHRPMASGCRVGRGADRCRRDRGVGGADHPAPGRVGRGTGGFRPDTGVRGAAPGSGVQRAGAGAATCRGECAGVA